MDNEMNNIDEEDEFEDDENSEDNRDDVPQVQLGFIENSRNLLFHDSNWNNWDGGKVGGNQ